MIATQEDKVELVGKKVFVLSGGHFLFGVVRYISGEWAGVSILGESYTTGSGTVYQPVDEWHISQVMEARQ